MSSPSPSPTSPTGAIAPRIIVVMGVSGSGKTTIAEALAKQLGWPFQEGDDLHPAANVAKMHAGHPLTDEDRWPWLDRVAAWITARQAAGEPGIITCSALRRAYRDRIRGDGATVTFLYLSAPRDVLADRLAKRKGHFMPPSLLDSQLATLEQLQPDEHGIEVDISGSMEQSVAAVLAALSRSTPQAAGAASQAGS